MNISDKADVYYLLHGGGVKNCAVNGTVYMSFTNATELGDMKDYLYVNGGNNGSGIEGSRDIYNGKMETYAVVNNVVITATNSKIALFGAGGSGSTKVNSATVNMTNCNVEVFFIGGINGELQNCDIYLDGCTIGNFAGTNRGFVGSADVNILDCEIDTFEAVASAGCFTTDSGIPDGSGVTGSVNYTIDANSTIANALLTPTVTKTNGAVMGELNNVSIQKAGNPIELEIATFKAHASNEAQNVTDYIIPNGSLVTLDGANVEVTSGQSLTNMGTITLDSDKAINVASGATFNDGGVTNAVVTGEGTTHKYVAKVGNTGYDSLNEALNAIVSTGGTVTLLDDCSFNSSYSPSEGVDITIAGDHTITAELSNSTTMFYLKGNSSLTFDGVKLNIKGTDNSTNIAFSLDVGDELNFFNSSVVKLEDLRSGIVSPGGESCDVNFESSELDADGFSAHFSNGANYSFKDSKISINDVATYALSCTGIIADNSEIVLSKIAYSAIYSVNSSLANFEFKNGSSVTVTGSGSALPYSSIYGSADAMIDVKKGDVGMNFVVDETSSVVLSGNIDKYGKSVNSIDVGGGSLKSDGQIVGNVVGLDSKNCVITVDGMCVAVVAKGGTYTLPDSPKNSGYIFLGWRDNNNITHKAGDVVTVNSDMTFVAVWGNLPDVKPSEPETPETPVFPFYDVTARDWYYSAVKYVYEKGLMDGVDVGVFAPNDTLTRAMVWTIIARAEGVDTTGGATWYAKAQEWVTAKGISDGENPNAAITRQELVTMLYRLAGEPAVSGTITAPDASSVSTWAQSAMTWAMNIGLVEGDENGAVTPTATATRAQAAALIMRYLKA